MKRFGTALGAILLAAGLSACGGSSSNFKTEALAECEKSPDNAKMNCACAVDILDKELDDKTKTVMLAVAKAQREGKDPQAALKEAGVEEKDMMELIGKLMPAMTKAEEQCKKA